jgi:DNA-binding protein Fis
VRRGVFVLEKNTRKGGKLMGADPAMVVPAADGPTESRVDARDGSAALRIAGRNESAVQRLVGLVQTMMRETQKLARDSAFAEATSRLRILELEAGIDFYSEVQQFETSLIRLALDYTGGNQAQAARVLGLKPTTLNSKMKLYEISI